MANLTINIPDAAVLRITNAFADTFRYQPTIQDANGNAIPNPETKIQFTKARLIGYIKNVTKGYEIRQASQNIVTEKTADTDAITIV